MKIGKLFMLAIALVLAVALVAAVLTACEPDGKKGEDSTGGGDAIFTEGVTLAELTEKINAAQSLVINGMHKTVYADGSSAVYDVEYKFDENSMEQRLRYKSGLDDGFEQLVYTFIQGEYDYNAYGYQGATLEMSKSLTQYGYAREFVSDWFESFKKEISDLLREDNGQIVINETSEFGGDYRYVDGSGYVRLKGNILEFGYKTTHEINGETVTVEDAMTVSLVNAYSFEITPELKEAEKTATWAEYVSYNGVDYRKAVDDTTGEEYYYVDSADDGAVAETTINTLPVKPRQ